MKDGSSLSVDALEGGLLVDSGGRAAGEGLGDVGVAQGLGVDDLLGGLLVDNDLLRDNLGLGLDLLLGGLRNPGDGFN